MSTTDTETFAWQRQSGRRRQGLARRRELLEWMLSDPAHQGLSGAEIAERCPFYEDVGTRGYRAAMADLNVMEEYECTVLRAHGRPVRWSVTALGAGAE